MVPQNNDPLGGENVPDGEESNGKGPKRQKSRHRASVACATCRERRIRVRQLLDLRNLRSILTTTVRGTPRRFGVCSMQASRHRMCDQER